jgi:exopolysaccharide production protein ExoQ
MNKSSFEVRFTIISLLFFTRIFYFNSFFVPSEGADFVANVDDLNPLTPLLSIIQHLIFLITLFFLLIRHKINSFFLTQSRFIIVLLIFIFSSFLWSKFPDLTLRRSISLIETTAFGLYFGSRYSLVEQLKMLVKVFGIIIFINIVFTLLFPAQAIEHGSHSGAWRGTLEHKNFFGRLMTLSAITFAIVSPISKKSKAFIRLGLVLSVVLILLSTSKTSLLAFLCLVALLVIYQTLDWEYRIAASFQLVVILGIACITTLIAGNLDYIQGVLGRDLTFTGRTEIWSATIQIIAEHPWIGYGYCGFWHGEDGPSLGVLRIMGPGAVAPHSHNGFIELATAVGGVGLVIFLLSFLTTFRNGVIAVRRFKIRERLWILVYLSFLVIYNQTENTLVEHNSIYWVIYVALSISRFNLTMK